jgi:uncharacterized protein
MKVAVIGSGIAGLGAVLALEEAGHEVHLFEKEARFGGHSHTIDVPGPNGPIPVDVGFIVYNEGNYPNLSGLFAHLGIDTKWSDMSFGFSLDGGRMEWSGDSLDTVFAQRGNALNPRFVRGVLEILRFNRLAREHLAAGRLAGVSLGDWLVQERFSAWFRDCYILPMGGAIWSTPLEHMLDFPMENFAAFFDNHDLLKGMAERRRWRTVVGGSRVYVGRVVERLGGRAHAAPRSSGSSAWGPGRGSPSPTARRPASTRWCWPATRPRRATCSPTPMPRNGRSSARSAPR